MPSTDAAVAGSTVLETDTDTAAGDEGGAPESEGEQAGSDENPLPPEGSDKGDVLSKDEEVVDGGDSEKKKDEGDGEGKDDARPEGQEGMSIAVKIQQVPVDEVRRAAHTFLRGWVSGFVGF